jgi:ADP-ribose pyrophosphatase
MQSRNHTVIMQGLVVDVEQFEVAGSKGWHTLQVVRHPGGAAVLPLHEDGTVTLIRQQRPAVTATMLEVPAGRLGHSEAGETCARRELLEETGLVANRLHPLGEIYSSPGVFDEVIHLFAATGLTQEAAQPEAYEEIEPIRMPLTDALHMARNGQISDAKTIIALFRGAELSP